MNTMKKNRETYQAISGLLLAALTLGAAAPLPAGEFRSFHPISSPGAASVGQLSVPGQVPDGFESLALEARARVPDLARAGIRKIFQAWNTGEIGRFLDPRFYDRTRFLDAMDKNAPRDAKIRILAIESVQPLEQKVQLHESGGTARLEVDITVSVKVRSQVEYSDARTGFHRNEGLNEFVLSLVQTIPVKKIPGR